MAIWQNPTDKSLFDDMDGEALTLLSWPDGLVELTEAQVIDARAPSLTEVKSLQVAILQAAYQASINQPIAFTNAAGVATTYPAGNTVSLNGSTAVQNLSHVLLPGSAAWTMGLWIDADGVAQTFTFADLGGLAAAMEAVQVYDWQDLIAKIGEVQSCTTVEAVQSVMF